MKPNVQDSFKALADPTRRMILMHLSTKDMTIGEVTDHFDMTRAAIKKHLNILEKGMLISTYRSGRERNNKLEPTGLNLVTEWLGYFDRFWNERLNKLNNIIEADKGNNND